MTLGPEPSIFERLLRLHPKAIDLSLTRVQRLLTDLGSPHHRLPPVVHVAGTNGKGSTIAFLRAMLTAAGYRVHVYTSPHLARFEERIRLAGVLITEAHLLRLLCACERVNAGRPITFFEVTTCAAFQAFADTPADILLLETGLGGRLDATNVVAAPAVTVITPVSMDHERFLGATVSAIAAEKAAIQKAGAPSVVGPQPPAAARVIAAAAAAVGAPLFRHGLEWNAIDSAGGVAFHCSRPPLRLTTPPPTLPGPHQIGNAATAMMAALLLRQQGFRLTDAALIRGVATAVWPARLQRLYWGSLTTALLQDDPEREVWLDGGHNPSAGEALAAHAAAAWRDRPLHLIFGMLNTKAATAFLRPLAPYVTAVRAVAIPEAENGFSATEAAAHAVAAGLTQCVAAPSLPAAAASLPSGAARILFCGSLYLAGVLLGSGEA